MKQKQAKRQAMGASPEKTTAYNGHLSPKEGGSERPNKSLSPSKHLTLSPNGPITSIGKVSSKHTATTDNLIPKDPKPKEKITGYTRDLRKTCRVGEERYLGVHLGINPHSGPTLTRKPDLTPKLRLSNLEKTEKLIIQPITNKPIELKKSSATDLCENKDRDLAQYIATQQKRLLGDSNKHFEKINDFQNKRLKVLGGKTTYYINTIKKAADISSPNVKPANNRQIEYERSPKIKLTILDDLDHHTSNHASKSEGELNQSSHHESSDKIACPTNRGSNIMIFSGTPKNGVISDRCKKNKRSPTLTESLNLTLLQCARSKDQNNQTTKQEKPKDKEKGIVKKDYEINDMYKIIQFLGKDKNLQSGKLELKEKLRRFRNDFKQSDVAPEDNEEHIDHIDIKITIGNRSIIRCGILCSGQIWGRQDYERTGCDKIL